MRLSRHRRQRREKSPRIALSQAEITADLHYPASRLRSDEAAGVRKLGANR
jgi:hypothetical protein